MLSWNKISLNLKNPVSAHTSPWAKRKEVSPIIYIESPLRPDRVPAVVPEGINVLDDQGANKNLEVVAEVKQVEEVAVVAEEKKEELVPVADLGSKKEAL